ncbi:MAG: dTDP-4-dehydrorhamnose reductase [Deltaproteobacteria bacterium ADurb.Bin510]|jgi:dTDP-4-dehydrorhamnose reductase|nr:MAG: dTDP-4-dehydrorhamnose reductase [Deltaproteobacteria bacterium ADurb.Bin510]
MKVLITGSTGMLGTALDAALKLAGHAVVACPIEALDICDQAAVERALKEHRPDWLANCAAITAVDACESELREICEQVNAVAPGLLGQACQAAGVRLLHLSTEYVFDGSQAAPYVEDDEPNPQSVYGRSKLKAEEALKDSGALIVRTQWLYGAGGKNFVDTMLRLFKERSELKVVADQWGSPTWVVDLAAGLVSLMERGASGVYHVSASGYASWHALAQAIAELSGAAVNIQPVTTAEYPLPAKRPLNGRLDKTKFEHFTGAGLPDWRDGLRRYLSTKGVK